MVRPEFVVVDKKLICATGWMKNKELRRGRRGRRNDDSNDLRRRCAIFEGELVDVRSSRREGQATVGAVRRVGRYWRGEVFGIGSRGERFDDLTI